MTETSVAYKQNTITIELENESVIKTETIMVDSAIPDAKVVTIKGMQPEKDGKGVIIIAVALGVIAMIFIGLCFRKFFNQQKQSSIDIEDMVRRSRNIAEPKEEFTMVKLQ